MAAAVPARRPHVSALRPWPASWWPLSPHSGDASHALTMRRSPRYRSAAQRIRRGFQRAEPVLDFVISPLGWFIEHGVAGVRRRLHGAFVISMSTNTAELGLHDVTRARSKASACCHKNSLPWPLTKGWRTRLSVAGVSGSPPPETCSELVPGPSRDQGGAGPEMRGGLISALGRQPRPQLVQQLRLLDVPVQLSRPIEQQPCPQPRIDASEGPRSRVCTLDNRLQALADGPPVGTDIQPLRPGHS